MERTIEVSERGLHMLVEAAQKFIHKVETEQVRSSVTYHELVDALEVLNMPIVDPDADEDNDE